MELLKLKQDEIRYLNLSKQARQTRTMEFETYINLDKINFNDNILDKFKENNYELTIDHNKYHVIIKDTTLDTNFITLKFAPIVELYTFIEYMNDLTEIALNSIIEILNMVDHEIPIIKEKNKQVIEFRRNIIENNFHKATNYLKIKLNNYVFNEFDFYIDIALTDSYIKMLEPRWLGVCHKVKNINLNDLINTIKDEEKQTLEYIINKSRNKEYSPMKLINKLLDEKSELTTKILNKFKENKNQDIALVYNITYENIDLYDFIDCNVINVVEPPLTIKDFIVIGIFKADEEPIIDKINNIIKNLEKKTNLIGM